MTNLNRLPNKALAPRFPADIPCRTNPDAWSDPATTAEAEHSATLCAGCPAITDCAEQATRVPREDRFGMVFAGIAYPRKNWRIRETAA